METKRTHTCVSSACPAQRQPTWILSFLLRPSSPGPISDCFFFAATQIAKFSCRRAESSSSRSNNQTFVSCRKQGKAGLQPIGWLLDLIPRWRMQGHIHNEREREKKRQFSKSLSRLETNFLGQEQKHKFKLCHFRCRQFGSSSPNLQRTERRYPKKTHPSRTFLPRVL